MLNETNTFQNRAIDLDDYMNRIGTVPKSTTNIFFIFYRTIAVLHFLQQLKLGEAQTTRYQTQSSPTNLSGNCVAPRPAWDIPVLMRTRRGHHNDDRPMAVCI
jgi:hypothetical protein